MFQESLIKTKNYNNDINIVDIKYISEDKQVFILGLNQGNIPKVLQEQDYLSKVEKQVLNINTALELNEFNKKIIKPDE